MYSLQRTIRLIFAAFVAAILTLVAVPGVSSAQEGARIHLIHGIPNTPVDVEVGGDAVFENFDFGDTQDLSGLSGQTLNDLRVHLAGTDTVAIDAGDVDLPASGNFTILAHLDADAQPALAVFSNDDSTISAGEGRLIVRHAAAAPRVDIKANGAVAFANVPNGAEGVADLPVGTVTAEVVPTGEDAPVVIGPADLPISDGEALIVYAVGSLDAGTLTVLTETISDLGSTPTRVNTGNSAVDAENGSSTLALILGLAAGTMAITVIGSTRRRPAGVEA